MTPVKYYFYFGLQKKINNFAIKNVICSEYAVVTWEKSSLCHKIHMILRNICKKNWTGKVLNDKIISEYDNIIT